MNWDYWRQFGIIFVLAFVAYVLFVGAVDFIFDTSILRINVGTFIGLAFGVWVNLKWIAPYRPSAEQVKKQSNPLMENPLEKKQ